MAVVYAEGLISLPSKSASSSETAAFQYPETNIDGSIFGFYCKAEYETTPVLQSSKRLSS